MRASKQNTIPLEEPVTAQESGTREIGTTRGPTHTWTANTSNVGIPPHPIATTAMERKNGADTLPAQKTVRILNKGDEAANTRSLPLSPTRNLPLTDTIRHVQAPAAAVTVVTHAPKDLAAVADAQASWKRRNRAQRCLHRLLVWRR
jgi:hypothetical protein